MSQLIFFPKTDNYRFLSIFPLMKVHYKQSMGIMMIISGIIIFGLNMYLMTISSRMPIQLFLGIFFIIIGAFYFKRPMFELRENEIVLFNAFGMVVKRYPFNSMEELIIVDNKIYIENGSSRKRVRLSSFSANKSEWDQFIALIKKRSFHSSSDLIDDVKF
ncbi:hypothetical protein [Taishania pollutisoli]|nr:hypothetical protein [Taishania pollutisoli]